VRGIRLRGCLGLLVLKVVSDGPTHAYGLLKRLRELTGHEELSVGVLYPVLRALINKGLIDVRVDRADGRVRKVYYVTEMGREFLKGRADAVGEALRVARRFRILMDIEVWRVFRAVRSLFEVADSLSEGECERLRKLFKDFEEGVGKVVGERCG